jgi:thioredoxin-like negative regulator of GroEL
VKHFWQGFQQKNAQATTFKKHVIVLFWEPKDPAERMKDSVHKLSIRYPSVKVKVVNVKKFPTLPMKHKVSRIPTVILLKDGREVDRLEDSSGTTLLENLFRRAGT